MKKLTDVITAMNGILEDFRSGRIREAIKDLAALRDDVIDMAQEAKLSGGWKK